jgi:hypothetical protein
MDTDLRRKTCLITGATNGIGRTRTGSRHLDLGVQRSNTVWTSDNCPRYAMTDHPLATWHRLVRTHDPSGVSTLLAEDAIFYSPVVHTPQRGRELASFYVIAAFQIFFNPTFRYVREITGPSDAMLEFETEIDGIVVNGVDLIKWNESGQIVEVKVLLRPLKAINLIHQRMAAMRQTSQ